MSDELERLRAVLEAADQWPGGPNPAKDAALRTLWPALLAVAEAADAFNADEYRERGYDHCFFCQDGAPEDEQECRAADAARALRAAIRAHLGEEA
ncbi:MAG TPA: hypothetical protein VM366_15975 [Anaerolineae bacterium]|nr:hypothetical protein [Anaerolineae bacterium]